MISDKLKSLWRPVTMFVFLGLIGSYWAGFGRDIPEPIVLKVLDLILFMGTTYAAGRTVEKASASIAPALSNTNTK